MKTIIFPVLQGVVARNILRTDFLSFLLQSEKVRLVFLVNSEEKKKYLQKEFNHPAIVYEVIGPYKTPSFQSIFTFLKHNLLKTKRMDIRRKIYLHESHNFIGYGFKWLFNRLLSRAWVRSLVRTLDMKIVRDENYIALFEKYKPHLIISAHLFGDAEASLVRQAKKKAIRSVGIVNSWDKMTSRSILRVCPDTLIVHNEIVKQEALDHADMKVKDIVVTGVPHYDIFFKGKPRSKEYFYKRFGIDIHKKIILFCPTGQFYSKNDIEILNSLIKLESTGVLGPDIQIFVRFPPNDMVDMTDVHDSSRLITYQPGIRFSTKRGIDWDMNDEDVQLLFDTVYWSSLVICPPSSLSIDAAIIDRPIINIRFGDVSTYSTNNINLYYDSDHYRQILKYDGIRLVSNEGELTEWIRKYLANPLLDKNGRRKIAEEQCWKLDGASARRMAECVLRELQK